MQKKAHKLKTPEARRSLDLLLTDVQDRYQVSGGAGGPLLSLLGSWDAYFPCTERWGVPRTERYGGCAEAAQTGRSHRPLYLCGDGRSILCTGTVIHCRMRLSAQ